MTQLTKVALEAQIATIEDNGRNTAAEVRSLLTNIKDSFAHISSIGFEHYSQNMPSYDFTDSYAGGNLSARTYVTPNGNLIKTYNYDGSLNLTSIVFSGAVPAGIATTKTLSYVGSDLSGVVYS